MKTIFWNVDTQNDFMNADGKLSVPNAEPIRQNLEKLTQYARRMNCKVISTGDWHTKESKEISDKPDFVNTFPEHCIRDTYGAEFIYETFPDNAYFVDWMKNKNFEIDFAENSRNVVIYKDDFDVFKGNPYTDKIIKAIKPERVVVYGVATNVCVDYAVKGLLKRGIQVLYVKDAIKELPGLPLEEVLNSWESKGAKASTTNDILKGKLY